MKVWAADARHNLKTGPLKIAWNQAVEDDGRINRWLTWTVEPMDTTQRDRLWTLACELLDALGSFPQKMGRPRRIISQEYAVKHRQEILGSS